MGSMGLEYGSQSGMYGSSTMFPAPSRREMPKTTNFLKAFGNSPATMRAIEPRLAENPANRGASLGINTDEQSFFDFDSHSGNGSPFQSQNPFGTPGGSIPGWGSDMNFRPLSPPISASSFSKDWDYGFQNDPSSSNILNNIQSSSNTRAQYGQVTPPDDEHDGGSLLDYQPREQQQQQQQQENSSSKKRKRGSASSKESQVPSKSTRKYTSRNTASSLKQDNSKPEDARRSKFLERNRVAASKCRQKKKEWTQNLEDRGRELQKNKSDLRMMVDSLRQEVLFLKGEMLKHNGCGCTHIHDFLKSGASILPGGSAEDDAILKRETSPIESMPRSRIGSIETADFDGRSVIDEEVAQKGRTNKEIAGDENALEALLTSSINHDTSEESVANQVGS